MRMPEHAIAFRLIIEFAITRVMKVFLKQKRLRPCASLMLHPDFIHAAVVLASGKAGLRPPMRVCHAHGPLRLGPR